MTFGWTFEHIDRFVTLPQLKEMSAYWAKHPPLHWRGIKKSALPASAAAKADDAAPDFFRDFVAAGGTLPGDLEESKEAAE